MVVDDLVANEVYELQVRAVNKAGIGEPCECNDFIKIIDRFEEPDFLLHDDFKSLISINAGHELNMTASFKGSPSPVSEWTKLDGYSINSEALITTDQSRSTLIIKDTKREDCGKYILKISNSVGNKQLRFSINVFDTPGCVEPITYKDVRSESVILCWAEPKFDGCSSILGYMIEQCDVVKQRWKTLSNDWSRTNFKAESLEEGKTYKFRVTAFNKYGMGAPKETEDLLKITHVPTAPLNVTVDEVSINTKKFILLFIKR